MIVIGIGTKDSLQLSLKTARRRPTRNIISVNEQEFHLIIQDISLYLALKANKFEPGWNLNLNRSVKVRIVASKSEDVFREYMLDTITVKAHIDNTLTASMKVKDCFRNHWDFS